MLIWKNIIRFAVSGNPVPQKRIEKTRKEWKDILTPEQFQITRLSGTEAPHSGAYCTSHDEGQYNCVCCGNELFDSTIKFESGTRWPSFTQPIRDNAIKYVKDLNHGATRIEILCNDCDSHLGHVFDDGPEPSKLRYCVNSVSLTKSK